MKLLNNETVIKLHTSYIIVPLKHSTNNEFLSQQMAVNKQYEDTIWHEDRKVIKHGILVCLSPFTAYKMLKKEELCNKPF